MTEPETIYRNGDGCLCADARFRVRYYETDRMGIVHHASYVRWFEEGRSAFTRALGYSYAQMEADGIGLAVSELEARYIQPARYDQVVVVTTCLRETRSRELRFTYEVRSEGDSTLLAAGNTRLISIDATGRVRRLPEELRKRLIAFGAGGQ